MRKIFTLWSDYRDGNPKRHSMRCAHVGLLPIHEDSVKLLSTVNLRASHFWKNLGYKRLFCVSWASVQVTLVPELTDLNQVSRIGAHFYEHQLTSQWDNLQPFGLWH